MGGRGGNIHIYIHIHIHIYIIVSGVNMGGWAGDVIYIYMYIYDSEVDSVGATNRLGTCANK